MHGLFTCTISTGHFCRPIYKPSAITGGSSEHVRGHGPRKGSGASIVTIGKQILQSFRAERCKGQHFARAGKNFARPMQAIRIPSLCYAALCNVTLLILGIFIGFSSELGCRLPNW